MPLNDLAIEAKINYAGIQSLSYANVIKSNLKKTDTMAVFTVDWSKKISAKNRLIQEKKLAKWLKFKLKLDTLVVKGY